MTREEAIAYFKRHLDLYCVEGISREAEEMAIKALEQEPILDKIRAEIADLDDANYDYEGYYKAVTDAVKVIDKYKESEEYYGI